MTTTMTFGAEVQRRLHWRRCRGAMHCCLAADGRKPGQAVALSVKLVETVARQ